MLETQKEMGGNVTRADCLYPRVIAAPIPHSEDSLAPTIRTDDQAMKSRRPEMFRITYKDLVVEAHGRFTVTLLICGSLLACACVWLIFE